MVIGVVVGESIAVVLFAAAIVSEIPTPFLQAILWAILPLRLEYPYINTSVLFFFWLPVIAQLIYVCGRTNPQTGKAVLISFLAWLAGIIILVVAGIAIGAESD